MRKHAAFVVLVWAVCSAICVSAVAYLGAGSPDRSPWLAAGTGGAVLGAAGGALAARWRGLRGGSLLMGLLFGVLLAIGYGLWRG